ncbi:MAG: hypothetical protein OIN88_05930 [Candidatus Methanoperedens sp.]|nr:hypothetical protein [Candidatus Methanoperedens sp.]MCZ7359770.1 hypothetical protein [Candidatus Methanoperedens sp.]
MDIKNQPEKIPERKLPEFKITKEQIQEMKTTSAILNMLADNPDLTKRIAEAFVKASSVKMENRVYARLKLKEHVTKIVAEKMKDISPDQVERYYPIWSNIIIRVNMPHIFTNIWADPGPVFGRGFE